MGGDQSVKFVSERRTVILYRPRAAVRRCANCWMPVPNALVPSLDSMKDISTGGVDRVRPGTVGVVGLGELGEVNRPEFPLAVPDDMAESESESPVCDIDSRTCKWEVSECVWL